VARAVLCWELEALDGGRGGIGLGDSGTVENRDSLQVVDDQVSIQGDDL
jgi:hypothetical protein